MRKITGILVGLLLFSAGVWLLTRCRKEEIVVVYSKINTVKASGITSTTTVIEGEIIELTTATHSEFGVCWDTVANPTVYIQKSLASGTPTTGSFTVQLTGLKPAKTYHARAFVIDNKKYIYGSDLSFTTTAAILPVVTTTAVTGITSKYAASGGNVTSQGDKPVIARGVCFDTIASPTILKNKTIDGWGTGTFTSAITNLKPSKKYYVRAYALSEFGVSYGSEVNFTTNDKVFVFNDEFTDNSNSWPVGSITNGTSSVTNGEYVVSFSQSGYLWRRYITISDFLNMANSKDFEISASIKNLPYSLITANSDIVAGLVWDCAASNFKYFGIKRHIGANPIITPDTYYFTTGSYNGSYTVWKDYTSFTGSSTNILTIKKANSKYYFFINDVQVASYSYSNITYGAAGFYIDNATLKADYFHLKQQGDKKSADLDMIHQTSGAGGDQDIVRSPVNN